MRTIKFRGLRTDGKGWVYGDLCYSNGFPRISNDEGLTFHNCIAGTECQFTGLLDKNGVEIYEDSIIQRIEYNCAKKEFKSRYEVIFIDTCFKLKSINSYTFKNGAICSLYESHNLEVIGNIHENKTLTK